MALRQRGQHNMGSGRGVFAVAVAFVAVSAWAQSAVETDFIAGDVDAWVIHPKEVSVYRSDDHVGGLIFTLTKDGLSKAKSVANFQTIVSRIKAPLRENPAIWIPSDYPAFEAIASGMREGRPFKFSVGSRLDWQTERLIVTRFQFVGPMIAAGASPCLAGGTWESGIISAKPGQVLKGPFVLLSLASGVDPVKPVHQFLLMTEGALGNEWLDVDAFRGPLYMGAKDVLTGRDGHTPRNVVYSGCRLKP